MATFDPTKPYNDLPLLPPSQELETRVVLKLCTEARVALAELKQNGQTLPNQSALSRALDENDQYFQREREKLEHWADDQALAAEQALLDTKTRIRDAKRRASLAETVEEQRTLQEDLITLERQQRRQRQAIFDVEDEIEARRDQLIEALEKRMKKRTLVHPLLRIRWQIV